MNLLKLFMNIDLKMLSFLLILVGLLIHGIGLKEKLNIAKLL
jgi:hypothetical protein